MWSRIVVLLLVVGCRGSDRAQSEPGPPTPGSATPSHGAAGSRAPAVDAAPPRAALVDELRALPRTLGDRTKALALHRQAMTAHAAKDFPASERLWAGAARADPSWDWPYYNLACSTARQARPEEALAYLEMVNYREPDPEMLRRIETDGDLRSLRSRPEYEALIVKMTDGIRSRGGEPIRDGSSHPAGRTGELPKDCPAGMVEVPAATFQMGSFDGVGRDDEHPQHQVALSAYCIDKTEVTAKAYAACVAAKSCSAAFRTVSLADGATAENVKNADRFCNHEDHPDHPVNCLDWSQAAAYCKWAGKRLPTEAEWEYAARGDNGRRYPWGDDAPSAKRLNAVGGEPVADPKVFNSDVRMYDASDGWSTTAPVGSFPQGVSPFGALDMAGNVAEWTADWDGAYSAAPAANPRGPKTGTHRVIRGGDWARIVGDAVSVTARDRSEPQTHSYLIGVRCVRGE